MRLFIAVNFDNTIKDYLYKAIGKLQKQGVTGNFSARNNLHLTLVFIGETTRINDIKIIMDSVNADPFLLTITGLGVFRRGGGDILWAGVKSENMLFDIQSQLAESLIKKDFKLNDGMYKPHLTLARKAVCPEGFDRRLFAELLPEIMSEIKHISLMKSERINGKLIYSEIYAKAL